VLLLTATALAEDGFDAHGFTLHAFDGDLRDPLTVDRPGPWEQWDVWAGGIAEYADRPLVRLTQGSQGNDPPVRTVMLDQLVAMNVNAGLALHDRVRLDVTAPVFFTSVGTTGYQPAAMGDVRVSSMVAIVRPQHIIGGGGFGAGVSGHADIPSGDATLYLGQGAVAGGFSLSGTYEGPWYTAAIDLGGQFNPSIDLANLTNSDQLTMGAAFNVLPTERIGITLETHLAAPFTPSPIAGTGMPAEVLLSFRNRFDNGIVFLAGGAAGISEGASAARFRAFLGFSYGRIAPARPPDADLLGNVAVRDRCAEELETMNGWKDDDGCPDVLGSLTVRAAYEGKDVDEGTLTVVGPDGSNDWPNAARPSFTLTPGTKLAARSSVPDRCLYGEILGEAGESTGELVVPLQSRRAAQVEVFVVDPAGVPIPDARIGWSGGPASCLPAEPPRIDGINRHVSAMGAGSRHLVVDAAGYRTAEQDVDVAPDGTRVVVTLQPSKVVLEATRIVILDKVYFAFNKSTILPESHQLLYDVATVITAHPEIGRVQVEGHTDDKGNDSYNLKLSQGRADAVKAFLITAGVPAERMIAAGFGEGRPIDTNLTEAGRSTNRRVEFNLIDNATPVPGEAGGAP
jgi:outer membrane protein OmpA-like peptidoglycan-associated protein